MHYSLVGRFAYHRTIRAAGGPLPEDLAADRHVSLWFVCLRAP